MTERWVTGGDSGRINIIYSTENQTVGTFYISFSSLGGKLEQAGQGSNCVSPSFITELCIVVVEVKQTKHRCNSLAVSSHLTENASLVICNTYISSDRRRDRFNLG